MSAAAAQFGASVSFENLRESNAAIASVLAAQIYGMPVLVRSIEDNPNNIARFFVIARTSAEPSGDDETSVMFTTSHQPGALVEALRAFSERGINLTHIDKRPSGRENWSYTFFLDAQGHREDPKIVRGDRGGTGPLPRPLHPRQLSPSQAHALSESWLGAC